MKGRSKADLHFAYLHERRLAQIREAANIQRQFIIECLDNNESSYYEEAGWEALYQDFKVLHEHEAALRNAKAPAALGGVRLPQEGV